MKVEHSICCICLQNNTELINANDLDKNNVKWSCKLKFCVPEVDWDENYHVCTVCAVQLDACCFFRNRCLQSNGYININNKEICRCPFYTQKENLNYTCLECNEKFVTKFHLTGHIITHAKESFNFVKDDGNISLKPDNHDINIKSEIEVKSKTPRKRNFVCEECNSIFISSRKLIVHANKMHGIEISKIKPFACDKCDSKFGTSSSLLQHKKYHAGKRTHICTFCGKGYITKNDLNSHEKQHLNKREYQCTSCMKTFNTHKNLRSHLLVVHTDPNSWKHICSFCSKHFPIKSNLDQHIRRHTGDKRFECHLCEKRFVDKIVLQKHIKSHSNFRPFKCKHCTKEYKHDQLLEVHMTKVHGIGNAKVPVPVKKYFCHACPKSYFAKNKLTRHVFSHTGERPYGCHVCEKKFTDKSYVKQHLKTTHGIVDVDQNN